MPFVGKKNSFLNLELTIPKMNFNSNGLNKNKKRKISIQS